MEISKYLRDARIKKNITQEDLAESLGVSRQTISSWENGKSYPDIISVIKISDLYQISLDKLLKEDKELIDNLQLKMDVVKSNKSVLFSILFGFLLFGGLYAIKTFVNIPKIENPIINIFMLIIFIVGLCIYTLKVYPIRTLLHQSTSNKSLLKIFTIIVFVIMLFICFPLINNYVVVEWQVFLARVGVISIFIIILLFIFKKIDRC